MQSVLHSFEYGVEFLAEQVADVAAADMAAQPGGVRNHPAWVLGHVTVTCQELGGVLGVPAWLPGDWGGRYGTGSVPVADAGRYEGKVVAVAMLRDARARIAAAVEKLDAARLDEPFPVESYRRVFPTVRHAVTQVLVGHQAYHIGQLALWRRAMGMPAMARAFE